VHTYRPTSEIFNKYEHVNGVKPMLSHTFNSEVVPSPAMKEYRGSGVIAPILLNLST
jgi:hypothetical protein